MKRIAKVTRIGIATTVVLCVVGVGGLVYLLSDVCGNDLVAEHLSPDGKAKLLIFQRDCGATTGFSTQASLVATEAKLSGSSGNLFIAGTDHGIAPSGPGGGPDLRVRWEGPKHLLLQHHVKARVFKAERSFNGMEVRYEALP